MPYVTEQPLPSLKAMSLTVGPVDLDKQSSCSAQHSHSHRSCHAARVRRFIVPALLVLLTTSAFLLFELVDFGSDTGVGVTGGLLRRVVDNGTGTNSNSPFVKNKLYLIVVLVGLFLCLVAAIMLSAWCCRGAFQNPLCCPCYLCACCGGLACLECISCGLCADGISDLNV